MKRTRDILIGLGCLCAMGLPGVRAEAQTVHSELSAPGGETRTEIRRHTYLKVQSELNLDSLRMKRKQSRMFTIVLSDGTHTQALRPVTVNGAWRHLMYLRELGEKTEEGIVMKCGKHGAGQVEYVDSCLYSPWMEDARLWLAEDLCGCGGSPMEQALRPLPAKMAKVERQEEKKVTPQPECIPERKAEHKVARVALYLDYLTFPVNRADILPGYGNNREELKKLRTALDSLIALPAVHIELVEMTGYASPEGPYRQNEELAYRRTIALRDYLQDIPCYRELPFRTASIAEDWEGLKAALEQSNMAYREELLMIVATTQEPDAKEENMKKLDAGKAYRLLKKDFLPKLRRTVCEIHYIDENKN